MVVARNCRSRRSEAARSSSPTNLMLPPEGTSEPFCNSPITVSEVTDFPEPLSPTRHNVSPLLTLSETPSMMRVPFGLLPRPTTRLSISRTMLVISPLSPRHCERQTQSVRARERSSLHHHCLRQTRSVCARERSDEAIQAPSFRDGALAPDPESRDSGFDASHRPGMTVLDHPFTSPPSASAR